MTTATAPYRSDLPLGRDGFARLLRAEWTKFRTVRGWVIAAVLSVIAIIAFAYLGTFRHETGACTTPSPTSCHAAQPHVPIGPDGEAVTDTYYFVHRTLAGDGSVTARVGSLSGLLQTGSGNGVSTSDLVGATGAIQPWAKAGLIVNASTRPGSAYAAVMLTGAHGVRMQYGYTHDTAGPNASAASARWLRLTRSGDALTGYESADGTHWTAVGSAHLAGLPASVQAGLFVTSPQTSPSQQFLAGAGGVGGGDRGHRALRPARAPGSVACRKLERSGHRRRQPDADTHVGRLSPIRRRFHRHRVRRYRARRRPALCLHRSAEPGGRVRRANRADRARDDVHHR